MAQEHLVAYPAEFASLPPNARGLGMTGISLSGKQVTIARELAAREANFLQRDADGFEPAEPFDFAWMVGVLGHFRDQQRFVRTSARLVRPSARFLLSDWVAASGLNGFIRYGILVAEKL